MLGGTDLLFVIIAFTYFSWCATSFQISIEDIIDWIRS